MCDNSDNAGARPSKKARVDCPKSNAATITVRSCNAEEKDGESELNRQTHFVGGQENDSSACIFDDSGKDDDEVTKYTISNSEEDDSQLRNGLPEEVVRDTGATDTAEYSAADSDDAAANSSGHQGKKEKISIPLRTGEIFEQELPPAAFILRPPVKAEEVAAARKTIAEVLDDALERIRTDGYDAYRRWAAGNVDGEDEGGMDSEEEAEVERQKVEQSLQDAVVRGNPRKYQTELFEIAKTRNTIVNLGTGQGKTLVALLLIRHMGESAFEAGKQTWFLVPSVALAIQHRITLVANLPYTVEIACHSSSNTEKARKKLSESNIVVATHGSAMDLLNHYGDIFHFRRVNLLVVDECHYACGNHRYTHIMQRHYRPLPQCERPHVLGLTASPFVNVKRNVSEGRLESMLGDLERTLDCTLATLPGMTGRQKGNVSNSDLEEDIETTRKPGSSAEERVVHYHSVGTTEHLPSHHHLNLHESRIPEFKQLGSIYKDLGPKATAVYSATLARECSRNKWMNETHEEFEQVKAHLRYISEFCSKQCENCPSGGRTEKLAVLEELLEDLVEEGVGSENDPVGVVFVDMRITALALFDYMRARRREKQAGTWMPVGNTKWSRKPKVMAAKPASSHRALPHDGAEDPLAAAIRSASMMGLPEEIVKSLDTGGSLDMDVDSSLSLDVDEFSSICNDTNDKKDVKNEIRCEVLVRHCTQVFKYLSPTQQPLSKVSVDSKRELKSSKVGTAAGSSEPWLHQQKKIRDVLDGMRRGETNVLLATSLVEEGVDVAACSFVIVFDRLRSSKSYVQMKGRARKKNARLYVFQDSHPRSAALKLTTLQMAQEVEKKVQHFLEARAARLGGDLDRVGSFLPKKSYAGESISDEEKALEEGEYRSENGVVDISSAKSLLNRYAISIPLDPSARLSRERMLLHMPNYNEDDTILTLPSHLPVDVRCVELPERHKHHGGNTIAGRRERQSMLALVACVRLHSLKCLNDRLLPLRHRDMHARLLKVALTRLPSFEPIEHANLPNPNTGAGERNTKVFIYPLHQSGATFSKHDEALNGNGRCLCLIAVAPLPDDCPALRFQHAEIGLVKIEVGSPQTTTLSPSQWDECSEFYTILMNARFRKRSKNQWFRYSAMKAKHGVLIPHIVGCLDEKGLLDWKRMEGVIRDYARTEQERVDDIASRNVEGLENFAEPRVICPRYDSNVKYIVYGPSQLTCGAKFPSDDIDGVKTYQDYFRVKRSHEVSSDCRLLAVQRFWHLPRRVLREKAVDIIKKRAKEEDAGIRQLQEGEQAPCNGLISCLLPQEACMEYNFLSDAHLFLHCVHLPHILFHMDRILQAKGFVKYCLERLPTLGNFLKQVPIEDLMTAITAKSCVMETNYDKLEWLGDAVLKLVHTDTLLHSRELRKWVAILHEGDLTSLRSAMGSNKRLRDASVAAGIDQFVLIFSLGRGQWVPSCLEMYEINEDGEQIEARIESVRPSEKVQADIMESLLGLIYVFFGFQSSVDVCVELCISFPRDPDMETQPTVTPKEKVLAVAKSFLGKDDFKHPELLEEALTHPSALHEEVPNYQRLEWVGDAVLCLAAREHVYRKYSYLGLAEMNIVEATFVCNETLAYLSVSSGLSRFINHRDPWLPGRLAEFQRSFGQGGRGLWGTDPPKVLSDVVESMFCAAHVDGGFAAGQKAVLFTLKPIIDTVTSALKHGDEFNPNKYANDIFMHPKQELHEMGGGILQIRAWREEDFAGCQIQCPLWCDDAWGEANEQGAGAVGVVQSLGINIVAALEPNTTAAKNRACALAVFAFHQSSDLMEKLKEISRILTAARDDEGEEDE